MGWAWTRFVRQPQCLPRPQCPDLEPGRSGTGDWPQKMITVGSPRPFTSSETISDVVRGCTWVWED